jgi:uncharacterized protein YndB with AHSA1/START domain
MSDPTGATDLVITRIFDAPRDMVYRAFVDPEQLAAWFGPVGWSVPRDTVDIDARTGGHQRFTMVSDEDPDMRSVVDGTFTEVVENELLIGEQRLDDPDIGDFVMQLRIEFHDEDGKTRMVLRQGPFDPEIERNAHQGWNSSFTKLDALFGA